MAEVKTKPNDQSVQTGKSCLYVNKLEDIDTNVLRELVRQSAEHMAANES